MRIVSLNAWGGALFDGLLAWLPGVRADVLCVQEVTRTSGLGGWTTFSDAESDADDVTRFEAPAAPEVSDHRPLVLDI